MRRIRLIALLFAPALLFAGLACGVGSDGNDEPTATRTQEQEATATLPVGEEPATTPAASSYESYRYTVDLNVTIDDPTQSGPANITGNVEGEFVAPDSHSFKTVYRIAGLGSTNEAVIIAGDAWYRQGGAGSWTATTADDPVILDSLSLTSADPGFIVDSDFTSGISALNSQPESLNGVQTRRYHIPKEAIDNLGALLGQNFFANTSGLNDFDMTVWLEDDSDRLVRAEFTADASPDLFGTDSPFQIGPDSSVTLEMTINLTDINDGTIEIAAPI